MPGRGPMQLTVRPENEDIIPQQRRPAQWRALVLPMPVLQVPVQRHLEEAAAAEVEVVGVSRTHHIGRPAKALFRQCISYLN